MIRPVYFEDDKLCLIDQRLLPNEERIVEIETYRDAIEAIKNMTVRGAPAIGITGAYALVLASKEFENHPHYLTKLLDAADEIIAARPTAVNLSWAVNRLKESYLNELTRRDNLEKVMVDVLKSIDESSDPKKIVEGINRAFVKKGIPPQKATALLKGEADLIRDEDAKMCRDIGKNGADLFDKKVNVLTHCNAGALATAEYGTALGVIRALSEEGKLGRVFADETRPLLQGARLTAYELLEDNIDTTLITDNMAAMMMAKGNIDCVVVGADRIAANGDTANKIGTYGVAILAKEHGLPFYIAAPTSTIDMNTPTGEDIVIEERNGDEVREISGVKTAPVGIKVENPAFDVTPSKYITGIITEKGVLTAPYEKNIAKLFKRD